MEQRNDGERVRVEQTLNLIAECEHSLFENSPVMMHSIDEAGNLVKVNQRWLETMRYQGDEVLGRRSTDFLTEVSQAQALAHTLPLFWRVGESHSIGYGPVRQDGRVIDVLLDAIAIERTSGSRLTLATLYDPGDFTQWQQATTTIKAIQGLVLAHHDFERIRSTGGPGDQPETAQVLLRELLPVTQDVLMNLRILANLEEERLHGPQSRYRELQLAETIWTALSDLASHMDQPPTSG